MMSEGKMVELLADVESKKSSAAGGGMHSEKKIGYAMNSDKEVRAIEGEMMWYHWMPFVNITYDLMLDAPPSKAQLKELLNLFGIIAALLLSLAGSFPSAVNFQEVQDALGRFSMPKDVSWSYCVKTSFDSNTTSMLQENGNRCKAILANGGTNNYPKTLFPPQWYLNGLGNYMNAAICSLTMSLIGVLFAYLFLINTSFENRMSSSSRKTMVASRMEEVLTSSDKKEQEIDFDMKMLEVWWFWVRIVILYIFLFLIIGIFCTFYTIHRLIIIKIPDVRVEQFGTTGYGFEPLGEFTIWAFVGIGGGTLFVLLIMSFALTSKYRVFFADADQK